MRKYLNYLIFGAVVAVVVGMAVVHNQHMQSLRNALLTSDPQAHLSAATELIKAEAFGDVITGETPETRRKIATALQHVPSPGGVKQALNLLKDQDKGVRAAATKSLKQIGATSKETISALVVGLKDGNVSVRKGTISALTDPDSEGGIGPRPELLDAILAIMKKENDARGPGGDVLSSPRFLAEGASAKTVPVLIGYLSEKDDGVKKGAADSLGKIGDPQAVTALLALVQDSTMKPDVRRVATGALALIAAPTCEPILTTAITDTSTDNEVRAQAARGLGKIGTPSALNTLMRALDDDDLKLRSATVTALARAGLVADTQSRQTVISDLIRGVADPRSNPNVRLGAAQALEAIHTPEANRTLIQILSDEKNSPSLRIVAANALGFPNNRVAVIPLIGALASSDGEVAASAQKALQNIGPVAVSQLLTLLEQDGPNALYAAQALGRQGNSVLPTLQKALKTAKPVAQRWLAVALGELNTAEGRPVLKQLAESGDETVKYVALQQLSQSGILKSP